MVLVQQAGAGVSLNHTQRGSSRSPAGCTHVPVTRSCPGGAGRPHPVRRRPRTSVNTSPSGSSAFALDAEEAPVVEAVVAPAQGHQVVD